MYPFSSRFRASALLRRQKVAFSAVALALVLHQTPLPAAAYTAFPSALITLQKNTVRLPAPATTITVSPGASGDADDGLCSLVEAIHNANSDDTSGSPDCSPGSGADLIQLPPASILSYTTTFGDSQTALPTITSPITIEANQSTVRRVSSDAFRLLHVAGTGDLTLNQATVSGGMLFGTPGGGVLVNGGTLTLTHSTVRGNFTHPVGYRSPTGAEELPERTALVAGSAPGGGIAAFNGTITLTNSTLSGNTAASEGGGIFAQNSTVTVTDSRLEDNRSVTGGGGIGLESGTLTLTNSTLRNNSGHKGGGLGNINGTTTIINSTMSSNAGHIGGGLFQSNGSLTITHSTVTGNAAVSRGGALYNANGTVTLNRSIVSGNGSTGANEIYNRSSYYYYRTLPGTIDADNYNVFGDSSKSNESAFLNFTPGATDITATSDGTDPTPLNGILAPLADNGGPTPTHALVWGSPALDLTTTGPATDQRGAARPINGLFDTGSFEAPILVAPGASGDADDGLCSLVEAIHNANNDDTSGSADCAAGGGADTIELPPNALLSYSTAFGSYSDTALPTITDGDGLTIVGQNSVIHREAGSPAFRLMNVGYYASLTLHETTISGGSVSGYGGGILNEGTLTLTNSTISGNSAYRGGGLYNRNETTITNSTISNNRADYYNLGIGGGLISFYGTITITNSIISDNSAALVGGGLSTRNSMVTVTNSTISGNDTAYSGGGWHAGNDTITVTNSTISGNDADYWGGGLFTVYSMVTVTNSTISGNSSGAEGGGLFVDYGSLVLNRSVVSGNRSSIQGDEIRNGAATTSVDNFNVFGDSSASNSDAFLNFAPGATDITATSDGTHPTPLAGILAPLANNGGPTLTHALVPNSPAIDVTADPGSLLPPSPATDQRGMPRPADGDGNSVAEYDAGSYEAEPALAVMLAEFQATPQNDHVLVTWETAQETDNLGFNLYRSTDPAQAGERLNGELIPSQVPGGGGAFYAFPDGNVNEGDTYYYTLESVSIAGQTALHGPVSATFVSPTAIEIGAWSVANGGENRIGLWAGMMAGMAAGMAWVRRRIKRQPGQ